MDAAKRIEITDPDALDRAVDLAQHGPGAVLDEAGHDVAAVVSMETFRDLRRLREEEDVRLLAIRARELDEGRGDVLVLDGPLAVRQELAALPDELRKAATEVLLDLAQTLPEDATPYAGVPDAYRIARGPVVIYLRTVRPDEIDVLRIRANS
jgi:plasmid stabilization system protein ParE